MVCCAVFGCKSNNNKKSKKDFSVSFYSFPKDSTLCEEWKRFCCRSDTFNTKHARICSNHFLEADKNWNLQQTLLGYSPIHARQVKPGSIPSLNGPIKTPEKSQSQLMRERKMLDRIKREDHQRNLREALLASEVSSDSDSSESKLLFESFLIDETQVPPQCPMESTQDSGMEDCQFELEALKAKIQLLEERNNNLLLKLSCKTETDEHWAESILTKLFSPAQIERLKNSKGKVNWSDKDINQAITLHRISPSAYKYLQKVLLYPLPSKSTIKLWTTGINWTIP